MGGGERVPPKSSLKSARKQSAPQCFISVFLALTVAAAPVGLETAMNQVAAARLFRSCSEVFFEISTLILMFWQETSVLS